MCLPLSADDRQPRAANGRHRRLLYSYRSLNVIIIIIIIIATSSRHPAPDRRELVLTARWQTLQDMRRGLLHVHSCLRASPRCCRSSSDVSACNLTACTRRRQQRHTHDTTDLLSTCSTHDTINRKSYTGSRLAPNSMTLNDLERQNRGFYGFLAISGCDTSLYHIATLLSLCDPDREFGICILT